MMRLRSRASINMTSECPKGSAGSRRGLRMAVMQPRFGPHHIARLKAAASLVGERGASVIGLETAQYESQYAWDVIEGEQGFERHVVFPGQNYVSLARAAVHSATKAAVRRIWPDVVFVCGWGFPEARAAILWARSNGIAVVLCSDTTAREASGSWPRCFAKRRVLGLCDSAFVSGTRAREYLVGLGFDPHAVVSGFDVVDNRYFTRSAASSIRPTFLSEGRPYWITVARMIPEKNLLLALEAYAKYRTMVQESWDWVICGDGPLRPSILAARERLRLESSVLLPGFLQVADLPAYYASASALWLPSVSETWGLVVNEAMACRLPILVAEAAGCAPDLVKEGQNGWSFDPSSSGKMAEALVRMHSLDPSVRRAMGDKSLRIIAEWDLQKFAQGLWEAAVLAVNRSGKQGLRMRLLDRVMLRHL